MAFETVKGLSNKEVDLNRKLYGTNVTGLKNQDKFWKILKDVITDPLFVILVFSAFIYFVLGEYKEGIIMLIALTFVSGISLYQENRSRNAVDALKKLSNPKARVIRDGLTIEVQTEEIVMQDVFVVEDGNIVPADAAIIESHDFSVNESILTGEALPVIKDAQGPDNIIFGGTMVMTGSCVGKVTAIGKKTELGKIGQSLQKIEITKTPLQQQIKSFVGSMVKIGVVAFFIVWGINYYVSKDILHGLMHGLTLAMSVLPEEIPVAFSTFMALGSYHLYKQKVIAQNPQAVETLGAATVICTDKTGTLTENKMQLCVIYDLAEDKTYDYTQEPLSFTSVLEFAMWASEKSPFDTMEKSIHEVYSAVAAPDRRPDFVFIREYPLSEKLPIMTHVLSDNHTHNIIACKGSVEGVIKQSELSPEQIKKIKNKNKLFASKGFRVLGVAKSFHDVSNLPASQFEFRFEFLGLVAFYDPPKENMKHVLKQFYNAGINLKMITGDYPETALAISEQINLRNNSVVLRGAEVMDMDLHTLSERVKNVSIFARMFPDAKLKVIEALKANGEVVAMTGDGVNDGPALKAAHIGVAMGIRGSEIAKRAASLILMNDDLSQMVDAVALGRRIYENFKKAVRYIISIHIPIICIVTIPLLFFWKFTDFFYPVHVIFLELIMGPTCSIIFENEPIEADSMQKKPRKLSTILFSFRELSLSIIQGSLITIACLSLGYYFMMQGSDEATVRTIIYTTLIFSNIFLTLVNRSFHYSILTTIKYRNILIPIVIMISLTVLFLSIYIHPVRDIFQFEELKAAEIFLCLSSAFAGVMWVEIYKYVKRKRKSSGI